MKGGILYRIRLYISFYKLSNHAVFLRLENISQELRKVTRSTVSRLHNIDCSHYAVKQNEELLYRLQKQQEEVYLELLMYKLSKIVL